MVHHENHLDDYQQLEQERDHYKEQMDIAQAKLKEVIKELNQLKSTYFKDGHY